MAEKPRVIMVFLKNGRLFAMSFPMGADFLVSILFRMANTINATLQIAVNFEKKAIVLIDDDFEDLCKIIVICNILMNYQMVIIKIHTETRTQFFIEK
jgi:hypothetical protein